MKSIIMARHFEVAYSKVRPSVALEDRIKHDKVHQYIKDGMGAIEALKKAATKRI
jgi:hypothetical protein